MTASASTPLVESARVFCLVDFYFVVFLFRIRQFQKIVVKQPHPLLEHIIKFQVKLLTKLQHKIVAVL